MTQGNETPIYGFSFNPVTLISSDLLVINKRHIVEHYKDAALKYMLVQQLKPEKFAKHSNTH